MNIEHIRAFLEVAATGSFQLAAEKLYVTQSTISARIKALEERLNRPLFTRRRNGAELTSGGHHFYRHALVTVRAWDRAQQEIMLPEELKAIVSLGVQLNHWESIAAPWLSWMQSNQPEIATQVVAEYSDPLMERVRAGLLDLAVLYAPQQRPDLVIETLVREELVLVSTMPRGVERGRVDGYVFIDWGESFRAQHSLAYPDTLASKLSVGLAAVGLQHILEHGGSGYFLRHTVEPLIQQGKLFYVEDAPVFQRPAYLAYRDYAHDPELLQIAIQGLKSIVQTTDE